MWKGFEYNFFYEIFTMEDNVIEFTPKKKVIDDERYFEVKE